MSEDYRVRLEAFEGPLDLLLHLIRRAEVDIHDIPISSMTEQYLSHLRGVERLDIDLAGEFLVMAATLMEIKSRMVDRLASGEAEEPERERAGRADEDASDPRFELVQQLLAYRKYRDAADALERRRETWEQRAPVRPLGVSGEEMAAALESQMGELDLDDLTLSDLAEAFAKIVATVNLDRLGEHQVVSDDTPIELHAEDIVDRLTRRAEAARAELGLTDADVPSADEAAGTLFAQKSRARLDELFTGRTRAEMVGLLLALLDLVRQHRVRFEQGQDAGGARGAVFVALRGDGAQKADGAMT